VSFAIGSQTHSSFNNRQVSHQSALRAMPQFTTKKARDPADQHSAIHSISQANSEQPTETDLSEQLAQEKSQSLAYQLMQAIARANGAKPENAAASRGQPERNPHTSALSEFELNLQYQSSQQFELQQELGFDNQQANFSIDFEFSQTETFNLESSNSVENTRISISLTRETQFSFSASFESANNEKSDPLILNLDQSDFEFEPDHSVSFDLNADGRLDKMIGLSSANAFLSFDKNQNGIIDNGAELFGDARGAVDGFADLARYDDNADNQIDAQDKIFSSLLLLSFGADGFQNLRPLETENIQRLSLNYQPENQIYTGGNQLIMESNFERQDGTLGRMGDFLLSIK